jgi:hypothetical protein
MRRFSSHGSVHAVDFQRTTDGTRPRQHRVMGQPEARTLGRRRIGVSSRHLLGPPTAFLLAIVIALGACGRTELDRDDPRIGGGAAAGTSGTGSGAAGTGQVPSPLAMGAAASGAATGDADAEGTAGASGAAGAGGSAGLITADGGTGVGAGCAVRADASGCVPPPNPPSCPATFSSLAPNADCDPKDRSLCEYSEGRCTCEWCSLGEGPVSRGTWQCEEWAPEPGCPLIPPVAATVCDTPGIICGDARVCDALSVEDVQCTSGRWQAVQMFSPISVACVGPPGCGATLTCSFGQAPAAPGAASDSATIEQRASDAALVRYDALVGRFLRGDVTVYAGMLSAMSTSFGGSPPAPTKRDGFLDGSILALFDSRPTIAADWVPPLSSVAAGSRTSILVVHELTSLQALVFGQLDEEPSTTWAGIILPDDPAGTIGPNPFSRSCVGCLSPLVGKPLLISFEPFVAEGFAPPLSDGGAPFPTGLTTTAGALGRVEPCTLRWPDLVDLNTAIGPIELSADLALESFVDTGIEMVSHESGTLVTGPATASGCVPQVGYTLDLWITKADLATHGVRGFKTVSTTVCAM